MDGWTDRRTEAIALPPMLMQSVKIKYVLFLNDKTSLICTKQLRAELQVQEMKQQTKTAT